MQALYPTSPSTLADEDLAELYGYPVERTWVRANFVASLDGAVQGTDERAGSLADRADRRVFALLRTLCDVVVVGAGTARAEGYAPVLPHEVNTDLRARQGLATVPAIAVVSRSLDISDELLRGGQAPTLVLTTSAAPTARRKAVAEMAEVVVGGDDDADPEAVVDALVTRGLRRILLEGGPELMRSFVVADRCDELCVTTSALLVGGDRHRLLRGDAVEPPRRMRLRHLLEEDGTVFSRYTRLEA